MARDKVFNPSGSSGKHYDRELTKQVKARVKSNMKSSGMKVCTRAYAAENPCLGMIDEHTDFDPHAGEPMPLSQFYRYKSGKYDSVCFVCRKVATNQRRLEAEVERKPRKKREPWKLKPIEEGNREELAALAREGVKPRRRLSDEAKQNIAAGMKGNKNAVGNKGCKGMTRSVSHKERIAKAMRRRWAAIRYQKSAAKNNQKYAWRKPKSMEEYIKNLEGRLKDEAKCVNVKSPRKR